MEPLRWERCVGGAALASLLVAPEVSGGGAFVPAMNVAIIGAGLAVFALLVLVLRLSWSGSASLLVAGWGLLATWLLRDSQMSTAILLLVAALLVLVAGAATQVRRQSRWRGRRTRMPY